MRVFTSFAIEDRSLRDLLVGQRLNTQTPFEFQDFSVKEPWDEKWKTNCRTRIRGCDGVIGIITHNTPKAAGQLWELKCAYEENVPVLLLQGYSDKALGSIPNEIKGQAIHPWTWDRISNFISRL